MCRLVKGARCDPGMRGCVPHGRYRFLQDEPVGERKPVKAPPAAEPGRRS